MMSGGSYWCHLCSTRVSLRDGSDPLCPTCTEGFLEQVRGGDPGVHFLRPALLLAGYLSGNNPDSMRSGALRSHADGPRRRWHNRPNMYPNPSYGSEGAGRPSTLQLLELMSYLGGPSRQRLGAGEARRDMEDSMFSGFFSRRGYLNDEDADRNGSRAVDAREFLLSAGLDDRPGLDALIQHFGEMGDGHHGSAPASKSSVDAMPLLRFKKQSSQADDVHCAVCKEPFEVGGEVREMPCKHIYHSDCILPWLARHRSCPICRHEMPAEDSNPRDTAGAEGSSGSWPARGQVDGNGGEFGVAIIGDLGFGIHVRSVTLWGLGNSRHDDGLHDNNPELVDSTSEGGSRPSTSSISSMENVASRRAAQRDVPEPVLDTMPTCIVDLGSQASVSTPTTAFTSPTTTFSTGTLGSSCVSRRGGSKRWGNRLRNWISRHSCSSIQVTAADRHLYIRSNQRARGRWW